MDRFMQKHCPGLTPREREVARSCLTLRDPALVAESLQVSRKTVSVHLRSGYKKTGSHRFVDFFAWSLAHRGCCLRRS